MSQTEEEQFTATSDSTTTSDFTVPDVVENVTPSIISPPSPPSFFNSMLEKFAVVDPIAMAKFYFGIFVIIVIVLFILYQYFLGKSELADDIRKMFGKETKKDISLSTTSTTSMSSKSSQIPSNR